MDCYNKGRVYGRSNFSSYGGICGINYAGGSNAIIRDCYNIGHLDSEYEGDMEFGGICGTNQVYANECKSIVKDSYYLEGTATVPIAHNVEYTDWKAEYSNVIEKMDMDFSDGSVCSLLNSTSVSKSWTQNVGIDLFPSLIGIEEKDGLLVTSISVEHESIGFINEEKTITGTLKLSDEGEISSDILSSEVSDIQWTSSDQSIVPDLEISCTGVNSSDNRSAELMVSFTPHKEGKVTITGTTSNGLTASCEVTVKNTEITEFSIDSYTKGTINNLYDISGKIKISETGESAEDILREEAGNIKWESSDSSVVRVTDCSITKVSEQGWAELKISVEPKKNGKVTITGTASDGKKASGEIEIVDAYIIQRVARYTSDNLYEQFDKINNSSCSVEKKYQKFYELFSNYGFTDVREGISYLSETTAERYAYLMLTTDDCFTASQFVYELNNTDKGKAMRAALVVDGLIFNSEWKTWTDPLSLAASSGEFPHTHQL